MNRFSWRLRPLRVAKFSLTQSSWTQKGEDTLVNSWGKIGLAMGQSSEGAYHVLWTRLVGEMEEQNRTNRLLAHQFPLKGSDNHSYSWVDGDPGNCLAHEGHVTLAPKPSCKENIVKPYEWDHPNCFKRLAYLTNHLPKCSYPLWIFYEPLMYPCLKCITKELVS